MREEISYVLLVEVPEMEEHLYLLLVAVPVADCLVLCAVSLGTCSCHLLNLAVVDYLEVVVQEDVDCPA